jgi:tRNA wybutosine-synthesizing protein 4
MSSTKSNGVPKAKVKQHEAIMGTNDYSTVSKRSVEKLYLREEPEFLRAFVHKFKRRTPLINRGYWLRMRAIEAVVKCFLNEETGKSKAVVNVGCGYEPLAFRMLWKYSKECQNVKFLDVDFPQLIQKKLEIITTEPSFQKYLDGAVGLDALHDSTFFDSERYCAVGCDLSGRDQLQYVLNDKLGLTRRSILFIDDSSTVYMPQKHATHLLQSCRAFPDGEL